MSRNRVALALFTVALGMALGSGQVFAAQKRPAVYAVIHGAPGLALDACLLPVADSSQLFLLGFIDNPTDTEQPAFTITLHDRAGGLLDTRTMPAPLPGASRAYHSFVDSSDLISVGGAALVDALPVPMCDDEGGEG